MDRAPSTGRDCGTASRIKLQRASLIVSPLIAIMRTTMIVRREDPRCCCPPEPNRAELLDQPEIARFNQTNPPYHGLPIRRLPGGRQCMNARKTQPAPRHSSGHPAAEGFQSGPVEQIPQPWASGVPKVSGSSVSVRIPTLSKSARCA
jgi:hypothetical protein